MNKTQNSNKTLTGGLWLLKVVGSFNDDILEVRPNPLRAKWMDTKNQSHAHTRNAVSKVWLNEKSNSKMKSTNMNHLRFFRKSKLEIPKVQMKSQRQHDWSEINVRNKGYWHVGG